MPEQETKAPEATEDIEQEVKPEPDKQAEEKEPATTPVEAKPDGDQGTISGEPVNPSDASDSANESDEKTPEDTISEKESVDEYGNKIVVDASDDKDSTSDDPQDETGASDDDGSSSHAGELEFEEEEAESADDAGEIHFEEEEAEQVDDAAIAEGTFPPVGQSPSPPLATIGISAVEPLPDPTVGQSDAVELLEDSAPRADVDIANDEQIANKDLIEKPAVDEEPDLGALPNLADDGLNTAQRETLDETDLASGDGDASDPSRSDPNGESDAQQAKLSDTDSKGAPDITPDDTQKSKESNDDVSDKLDSALQLEKADEDGEGDTATVEGQPTEAPIVELALSAAVELTDQDEDKVVETEQPPADLVSDSPATSSEPTAIDQSLDVFDFTNPAVPAAGILDPVAGIVIEDGNSPISGPNSNAAIDDVDGGAAIDSGDQGEGQGPVSDRSGIESGSATFTEFDDGAYSVAIVNEDGSQVILTQETNGDFVKTEASADGTTVTETTERAGKVVETRTETIEKDGTLVTTKTTHDESGETTTTTTTQKETEEDKEAKEKEREQQQKDDDDDDETTTAANTASDDANTDSASRPDDDGLVDEDKLAAMQQAEAEAVQAIRDNSLINPQRTDVGAAESGGDPPPGVDDPPEDESLRTDELPEDDPIDIALTEGTIDFGPDHVDEPQGGGNDPSTTEDLGGQPDQQEVFGADPDDTFAFDPAAIAESSEELLDAFSGISPDSGLSFWGWRRDSNADTDEDQGAFDDGEDLI